MKKNFGYNPTSEGSSAFYSVNLIPKYAFKTNTLLQVVFPIEFPMGLGTKISCKSSDLQKSDDSPLQIAIDGRRLNITNMVLYDPNVLKTGFTITLAGIVNPNKGSAAITNQIGVYIFKDQNTLQEYTYGIGSLSYTTPPPPIFMSDFTYQSSSTRVYSDYTFKFTASIQSKLLK